MTGFIKKLQTRLKKPKGGYQSKAPSSLNIPGQRSSYGTRKNRVVRIKQWISNRNRQSQQGYMPSGKKKKNRLRLVCAMFSVVSLALFFGLGGVSAVKERLLSIRLFHIDTMRIVGNSIVTNDKIKDAAGIVVHQTSMLGIRKTALEEELAGVPWVASARVKRNWPSAVEIEIKENIPLALIDKGTTSEPQLHYIDKYGVSFLPVTPGGMVDFPVITGLSSLTDSSLKEQALSEALIFLQKVRRNDPHLPAHSVSEVHINSEGQLVVYLVEYPFPIFFGNGNTKQNYGRLIQVLKALYKKEKGKNLISKIEYIQMDYLQDKVLVAQTGSG